MAKRILLYLGLVPRNGHVVTYQSSRIADIPLGILTDSIFVPQEGGAGPAEARKEER
jgi:hypothetical protein